MVLFNLWLSPKQGRNKEESKLSLNKTMLIISKLGSNRVCWKTWNLYEPLGEVK